LDVTVARYGILVFSTHAHLIKWGNMAHSSEKKQTDRTARDNRQRAK